MASASILAVVVLPVPGVPVMSTLGFALSFRFFTMPQFARKPLLARRRASAGQGRQAPAAGLLLVTAARLPPANLVRTSTQC